MRLNHAVSSGDCLAKDEIADAGFLISRRTLQLALGLRIQAQMHSIPLNADRMAPHRQIPLNIELIA
jgi:hypothetical protein